MITNKTIQIEKENVAIYFGTKEEIFNEYYNLKVDNEFLELNYLSESWYLISTTNIYRGNYSYENCVDKLMQLKKENINCDIVRIVSESFFVLPTFSMTKQYFKETYKDIDYQLLSESLEAGQQILLSENNLECNENGDNYNWNEIELDYCERHLCNESECDYGDQCSEICRKDNVCEDCWSDNENKTNLEKTTKIINVFNGYRTLNLFTQKTILKEYFGVNLTHYSNRYFLSCINWVEILETENNFNYFVIEIIE